MRALRLLVTGLSLWWLGGPCCQAQAFRRGGTEFNALRQVVLPSGKAYSVVFTEFFHHGQIAANGRNVMVFDQRRNPVPTRVMQVGPGDYCRVAFQIVSGQNSYEILYGGNPPTEGSISPWTSQDGLVLETREFKDCDPNQLESVRKAFESSRRIGSGYVPSVQHGCNPFSLAAGPFLSRYSGTLRVKSAGTYGFATSSQDCSFLLIDGKVVTSAPGRHGPEYRARPGVRKDIQLTAGPHALEYYHAAMGQQAIMVAAWAVSPADAKAPLTVIPSEAFRAEAVGQAPAGPPSTPTEKLMPDYLVHIAGEVPLPETDLPLIGVQFTNASPPGLKTNSKTRWDFGDGQTSEEPSAGHVYLRPGLYTVTLKVTRGGKTFEMSNHVAVDRPQVTVRDAAKLPKLDDYLRALETYDPASLDSASLVQLILAYRFKADVVLAGETGKAKEKRPTQEEDAEGQKAAADQKQREAELAREAEAKKYLLAAVEAAKAVATTARSTSGSDEHFLEIARLTAPVARDQLGDSQLAGQIWHGVSQRIERAELKAECEVAAADIAVSDLANAKAAKTFLEAAEAHLGRSPSGTVASRLRRVWGDYHALSGDGAAARKAYHEAEAALASTRRLTQQTAWQGAHNRSTEEFLRTEKLDRAAAEIHRWEDMFPADKLSGHITLFYARYWAARRLHNQVVAMSERLLAVNPESPYADQVLMLAADSELRCGRTDRALATLHALLKDYPGSPLVPAAKERIAQAQATSTQAAKPGGK